MHFATTVLPMLVALAAAAPELSPGGLKGTQDKMMKRGYRDGFVEYDDPKKPAEEAVKRDGARIMQAKRGYRDGFVEYDDPKKPAEEAV